MDLHTTVDGRISSKGAVYVTVGCSKGDDLVYLSSAYPDANGYVEFSLVDQAGAGLNWENGGDALCDAWLIYRVDKGKSSDFTVITNVVFWATDPPTA